jgi:hypothetical protein
MDKINVRENNKSRKDLSGILSKAALYLTTLLALQ